MLLLNDKLNLGTIIDKEEINNSPIVKNALKYADKYKNQLEELTKDKLNKEEQKAVEKLLPSWYHYQLEVEKESDEKKKEEIYLKGLNAYPKSHELMNNYANLLVKLNKDNEVENYYKKALEIEPNNANCNGNYARLLLIQERTEEAKSYIENAFRNHTTENDLLVELWFYRLAHYPEYFEEGKKELDELLEKGIRSIDWDFSRNIEQAKKEGHKDIKLLEEYAKKITNP
jgi:predicted Zn-dependent protease